MSTSKIPIVETKTHTVTYEKDGVPFEMEDSILISAHSVTTKSQTIDTTTVSCILLMHVLLSFVSLRGIDMLATEVALPKIFLSPLSVEIYTYAICSPRANYFCFLYSRPLFSRGFVCRKANRMSQKMSLLKTGKKITKYIHSPLMGPKDPEFKSWRN